MDSSTASIRSLVPILLRKNKGDDPDGTAGRSPDRFAGGTEVGRRARGSQRRYRSGFASVNGKRGGKGRAPAAVRALLRARQPLPDVAGVGGGGALVHESGGIVRRTGAGGPIRSPGGRIRSPTCRTGRLWESWRHLRSNAGRPDFGSPAEYNGPEVDEQAYPAVCLPLASTERPGSRGGTGRPKPTAERRFPDENRAHPLDAGRAGGRVPGTAPARRHGPVGEPGDGRRRQAPPGRVGAVRRSAGGGHGNPCRTGGPRPLLPQVVAPRCRRHHQRSKVVRARVRRSVERAAFRLLVGHARFRADLPDGVARRRPRPLWLFLRRPLPPEVTRHARSVVA